MKTKTDSMENSRYDLAVRILKDDTISFEVYEDCLEGVDSKFHPLSQY